MAIHVLIGAAVGAVLGAGTSVVTSLARRRPIDWKSVGAAALGGAAAGAITTLTFGAGALAGTAVARVGGMTLAGAAGGFSEQTSDNLLHGETWSRGVVRSTAEGAAMGAGAGVLRQAARPLSRMLARNPAVREAQRRTADAARTAVKPVRQAYARYQAALTKHPRKTMAATSATITATGDLIAQSRDDRPGIDWKRTLYRSGYSAAWSGTLGWTWLKFLERAFPGGAWRPLLTKVGLDQLVMGPLSSLPFYAGFGLVVEGDTPGQAARRGVSSTYEATKMGLPPWFAFTLANFKLARPEMRPVLGNLAGLVWSVVVSRVFDDEKKPAARPVIDRPLGEEGDVPAVATTRTRPAPSQSASQKREAARPTSAEPEKAPQATGLIEALAGAAQ